MTAPRIAHVVVTCEHATNRVPPDLARCFWPHRALLKTHRGYDPGALAIAERLAASLAAPLFVGEVSRLVVELNRSPDSPSLFSAVTSALDDDAKGDILRRYYHPWRAAVRDHITRALAAHPRAAVLHLSIHSFTPVLDGKRRDVDIGLLFDPARPGEKALCERWRAALTRQCAAAHTPLRIKMNHPYRGTSDGHTTALRAAFPPARYLGIELEVCNALLATHAARERLGALIAASAEHANT